MIHPGASAICTIPKDKAVSIHENALISIGEAAGIPLYMRSTTADSLEKYIHADIIIVSSWYSNEAEKAGVHPLLLSRLYFENRIYANENSEDIVGAASLIKPFRLTAQMYRFYISECQSQRLPWKLLSLYSMAVDMVQAEMSCRTEIERNDIDFVEGFVASSIQGSPQQPTASSLYY